MNKRATFGKRLNELRREQRLTLDDVAKLVDRNMTTISRWENGGKEPEVSVLEILADYFEVTVDYLLGRSNVRNENFKTSVLNMIEDLELLKLRNYMSKKTSPLMKCKDLSVSYPTSSTDNSRLFYCRSGNTTPTNYLLGFPHLLPP